MLEERGKRKKGQRNPAMLPRRRVTYNVNPGRSAIIDYDTYTSEIPLDDTLATSYQTMKDWYKATNNNATVKRPAKNRNTNSKRVITTEDLKKHNMDVVNVIQRVDEFREESDDSYDYIDEEGMEQEIEIPGKQYEPKKIAAGFDYIAEVPRKVMPGNVVFALNAQDWLNILYMNGIEINQADVQKLDTAEMRTTKPQEAVVGEFQSMAETPQLSSVAGLLEAVKQILIAKGYSSIVVGAIKNNEERLMAQSYRLLQEHTAVWSKHYERAIQDILGGLIILETSSNKKKNERDVFYPDLKGTVLTEVDENTFMVNGYYDQSLLEKDMFPIRNKPISYENTQREMMISILSEHPWQLLMSAAMMSDTKFKNHIIDMGTKPPGISAYVMQSETYALETGQKQDPLTQANEKILHRFSQNIQAFNDWILELNTTIQGISKAEQRKELKQNAEDIRFIEKVHNALERHSSNKSDLIVGHEEIRMLPRIISRYLVLSNPVLAQKVASQLGNSWISAKHIREMVRRNPTKLSLVNHLGILREIALDAPRRVQGGKWERPEQDKIDGIWILEPEKNAEAKTRQEAGEQEEAISGKLLNKNERTGSHLKHRYIGPLGTFTASTLVGVKKKINHMPPTVVWDILMRAGYPNLEGGLDAYSERLISQSIQDSDWIFTESERLFNLATETAKAKRLEDV